MIQKPIQRRHKLANRILNIIRDAKFEPGHHLREQALGDLMQVSRTPIRAALQLLAERGVLEARRNQGFVLKVRPEEISRIDVEVPSTTDEDLYIRIVQDRLQGVLAASFNQSDAVERYDVDRGVLQRTLTRLVDDGLLQQNAGRGWSFMPALDTGMGLRNSYEFRLVVEPAALLLPGFRVDHAAVERSRLQHFYLEAHPNIEAVDRRQLFETDEQFHEMLSDFSGNPLFLQVVQQQNRMRRLFEFSGYVNRRRVRDWCREHLSILDAIVAGDRDKAAGLMREHLQHALLAAGALKSGAKSTG